MDISECWHWFDCQLVVGLCKPWWVNNWKVIFLSLDITSLFSFYGCSFIFILVCIFYSQSDSAARWVDPLLHTYSDYEDSIYGKSFNFLIHKSLWTFTCWFFIHFTGLTWSSREPWIFASLSYDGRVRKISKFLCLYILGTVFGGK